MVHCFSTSAPVFRVVGVPQPHVTAPLWKILDKFRPQMYIAGLPISLSPHLTHPRYRQFGYTVLQMHANDITKREAAISSHYVAQEPGLQTPE